MIIDTDKLSEAVETEDVMANIGGAVRILEDAGSWFDNVANNPSNKTDPWKQFDNEWRAFAACTLASVSADIARYEMIGWPKDVNRDEWFGLARQYALMLEYDRHVPEVPAKREVE